MSFTVEPAVTQVDAAATMGAVDRPCVFYVGAAWAQWSPGEALDVFIHEAGHCLGLWHSDDPDSVMWPEYVVGNGWRPIDADYDALRAARPQMPYRVVVGGVVH